MSDFWRGVLTVPLVLLLAALTAAIGALLLDVWFRKGVPLLRFLPSRMDTNYRRALHASVMATADRGCRLFWIAGFGVYLIQHGELDDRRKRLRIQADIETELRDERHEG